MARSPYKIVLRKSHPSLYWQITILSITSILLAVNFWTSDPTFHPYGWDDNVIGAIFAAIGLTQLVFLNVWHNLRIIRGALAVAISWNVFWAFANTQQIFDGNASWQLPILYLGLAAIRIPMILESPVNPMTERR